jgi:hypothetical protein
MPTPEELQYILGIHPSQIMAPQPLQGASFGEQEAGADNPAENPTDNPASNPAENPDAGNEGASPAKTDGRGSISAPVVEMPSRASKIEKPKEAMGPAVPPEVEARAETPDLNAAKPDEQNISSLMSTPIQPMSQGQATMQQLKDREGKDRTELNRLRDTGSGISQFAHKHSLLGKIIRPLEIAGSVISPSIAQMVPGTELHHALLENRQRNIVNQDEADEGRQEQMNNRDEVTRVKGEAEEEKRQHDVAMEELKRQAEANKEANRAITWNANTRQFVKGDKPYTPKDFQEGAILEQQYGIKKGPYTELWLREKRNQEPVTHIHNASAESQHYNDVKSAFARQYGHEPQSPEDFDTFNQMLKGEHGKSAANQHTFKDQAAVDKYSNDWYAKQRKAVLEEKSKVRGLKPDAGDDDAGLQQEYGRIENEYKQRAADFESQKKNWYSQLQSGKPVTVSENESGIPEASAGAAGAAKPQSGAPVKYKTGDDVAAAPAGAKEGRTGKLADGTRVVVKGGRLVAL